MKHGYIQLSDRTVIRDRFADNPSLHVYELGDLDDFFFAKCRYFGSPADPHTTVLLYEGSNPHTLLAIGQEPSSALTDLVLSLSNVLPNKMYAHLAKGMMAELGSFYDVDPQGPHWKLARPAGSPLPRVELANRAVRVTPNQRDDANRFYEQSYPGTWFTPNMLETGFYFGVRDEDGYLAIAGVHVVSRPYRVAALGNVATHPDHRGKGLARATCARLLEELEGVVDHVGLNVAQDNRAALACYRSLGFEVLAHYDEAILTRRT